MTQPLGEEFILIRPSLTGFRAALEAQLKAAIAGIKPTIAVQARVAATQAAAAPSQAAARAAQAVQASSVVATSNLGRVATATDNVVAAQKRLATAAQTTKSDLGGIVLPPGVRNAVTVTQSAAAAQQNLARATRVTKEELAGIVLPPGIRSVTVASEQAAAAQQKLAAATAQQRIEAAAASATGGTRTTAGGVILPPAVRDSTVANKEAIRVQKELASSTTASKESLSKLSAPTRDAAANTRKLSQEIQTAETAAGRYTRGMVAATAASTGFFRAVSFASGAFLVGAAVGATIGSAVNEFKQMTIVGAQTAAVIRATGGAANVTAGQVDELAKRQLKLTGVDDEIIKSSANILLTFRQIRNEVGAGNDVFDRAVKAVQDISSVFNTDMRGSAVQVGKALQDPIRGVTALRRSGITLSQSQRDLIKQLVETGRQFTAEKVILAEIEKQVGGTAQAIGQTLPGRLAILRESAKNSLGEFVKRVSESQAAARSFTQITRGFGDAFNVILPPIVAVSRAIGGLVKGLEELGILRPLVQVVTVAAVAFGALKLALGIATAAETLYVRATTVATAATVAQGVAAEEAALATGASAAAATAAGTAAAASAARVSLAAGALAALRGPLGIALGITAVTIGFVKLRDVLQHSPGTINATRQALDGLNDAIQRNNTLRGNLAGARENVSVARFDVLAGQREVGRAQAAVQASPAQQGSIEQLGLSNRLLDARNKLADANKALAQAEQERDRIEQQLSSNERSRQFVIQNTTKDLLKQIAAARQRTVRILGLGDVRIPFFSGKDSPTGQLSQFDKLMDDLIRKGNPLEQKVGRALETIRQTLGKIPSQKDISLVVKLAGQGASLDTILSILGAGRGTEALRARGITPPPSFHQQQEEALRAAQAAVAQEQKRLRTLKEISATRQQELATQKEQVSAAQQALQAAQDQQRSARRALADARQAARDSRQNLTDTLAAGRQLINQAVNDAKSNLNALGQTIAQALGQGAQSVGGNLSGAAFRRLRAQILAGQGGPETRNEAVRLAQRATQEQAAPAASNLEKRFGNLTNAFNNNRITLGQLNRALTNLVRPGAIAEVRRTQGNLAADTILAQVRTLRQQAGLIAAGPRRPGAGLQQTLVDPLKAVSQAARDAVGARRDLAASLRSIRDSQRDLTRSNQSLREAEQKLREAQQREQRANTRAVAANTRATNQLARVLQSKRNLQDKPKPKGNAAKDAGDLNLVGAGSP